MYKSKYLELSKKNKYLRKLYIFYNIFIRNRKFLKKGTQFGEDEYILDLFTPNTNMKISSASILHS